jgi:hypothetical protein
LDPTPEIACLDGAGTRSGEGEVVDLGFAREFVENHGEALGVAFCTAVASATGQRRRDCEDRDAGVAVRRFLRWLQEREHESLDLFRRVLREDYRRIPSLAWEAVSAAWRSDMVGTVGDTTVGAYVGEFNAVFGILADRGELPRLYPISGVPNADRKRKRRPGVVEVAPSGPRGELPGELAEFRAGLDEEAKEAFDAVSGEVPAGFKGDIADLLVRVTEERLALIRACAEQELRRIVRFLNEFKALAPDGVIPPSEINACGKIRKRFLAKARELVADDPWLEGHGFGARLDAVVFTELLCAAATIYMTDSGANPSVCCTLPVAFASDMDDDAFKLVVGHKERASGRPFFSILPAFEPDRMSAVEALGIVATATAPLRARVADPDVADHLFLFTGFDTTAGWARAIRPLSADYLGFLFAAFRRRHPELERLPITPAMLRPSVLFLAQMRGGLAAAQAKANHASMDTTWGYTTRLAIQRILERKIRVFQDDFQTVIAAFIPAAAARLGITQDALSAALGRLDVAKWLPGAPGAALSRGTSEHSPVPIFVDAQSVAAFELLRRDIEHEKDALISVDPGLWRFVWQPWLALATTLMFALEHGATGHVVAYDAGIDLADALDRPGRHRLQPIEGLDA